MPSNINSVEFAFRKCGPLNPNVYNPFAPMIRKPKEFITSGLKYKIDTHAIINILKARFGNIIDKPLELIPKIYTLGLTSRQSARYFKALYQALPLLFKNTTVNNIDINYSFMYYKYYHLTDLSKVKPFNKRHFIKSCKDNTTPLNKLYEIEYYKFSRFDS